MHLAPVPGCGTRLELHRRNIGAGDNKIALDVAHGEGGHRASLAQKKKPRAWRGKNGIAVRANQPRRNEPTRMGWTGRAPAPNRSDGEDRDGGGEGAHGGEAGLRRRNPAAGSQPGSPRNYSDNVRLGSRQLNRIGTVRSISSPFSSAGGGAKGCPLRMVSSAAYASGSIVFP